MSDVSGKVELNPSVDFIAGTMGGMAGLVFGFPFDTLKVRFQTPNTAGRYHSITHAITTIVKEERLVGLYKGMTSPLATVALMNGLVFASYGFLLRLQMNGSADSTLMQVALAGAGSGIISSVITTPTELIKIRQQSVIDTRTSARQVTLDIVRDYGLKGLYRGVTVTALRDCGYGAYFLAYEASCRYLTPAPTLTDPTPNLSWAALLTAGGIAGMAGWAATFPLDVVKTRVQASPGVPFVFPSPSIPATTSDSLLRTVSPMAQSENSNSNTSTMNASRNPYKTTLSTIVHSYRSEGLTVFYRGLGTTLIR